MKIVSNPRDMQQIADRLRCEGKKIGFVPTMGYLHEGHLSLVRAARKESDIVVVSIFVNPTQFGPREDYDRYPQDLDRDCRLLEMENTDLVFTPIKENLYPEGFCTSMKVENLTDTLCGASRPWHFPGVVLIVCKLFHLVKPHVAFFGQKDYQQAQVIRRMVLDLDFDIEIRVCPIVREPDGLAMSSRNTYLSQEERREALVLSKALREANDLYLSGERNASVLREKMRDALKEASLGRVDYAEVVDGDSLRPIERIDSKAVALVAVYFNAARLIDNHILGEPFPRSEKGGASAGTKPVPENRGDPSSV